MKKVFLFLVVSLAIIYSCKDDKEKFNYKMSVFGRETPGVRSKAKIDSIDLVLNYTYKVQWDASDGTLPAFCMGIGDVFYEMGGVRRDFENKRFIFSGSWVILSNYDGKTWLGELITDSKNVLFIAARNKKTGKLANLQNGEYDSLGIDGISDTIAYIPNAIMQSACQKIKNAYEKGDYETCYSIFDTAFIFIPTTGEKWKKMKQTGIE